jgi:hypothetical protein
MRNLPGKPAVTMYGPHRHRHAGREEEERPAHPPEKPTVGTFVSLIPCDMLRPRSAEASIRAALRGDAEIGDRESPGRYRTWHLARRPPRATPRLRARTNYSIKASISAALGVSHRLDLPGEIGVWVFEEFFDRFSPGRVGAKVRRNAFWTVITRDVGCRVVERRHRLPTPLVLGRHVSAARVLDQRAGFSDPADARV